MQPGIGVIETCRRPIRLELFGVKPLEHLLNPPRVDVEPVFRREIRVGEHRPSKGTTVGTPSMRSSASARRAVMLFLARGGVHNEFGEHGIEMVGDNRNRFARRYRSVCPARWAPSAQ